jgi:hypothetical protein
MRFKKHSSLSSLISSQKLKRPKTFEKFAGKNSNNGQPATHMDLLKTKIYLDKLNREFTRMSKDPENIVRIDADIMLAYVRELYDAILTEQAAASPARQEPTPAPANHRRSVAARSAPAYEPTEEEPVARPAHRAPARETPPPPPEPVYEEPARPAPRQVYEEPVRPAPPPPPPPPPAYEEPVRAAAPAPERQPEPVAVHKTTPGHQAHHHAFPPEAEQLFEEKKAKELSEKLSELPIPDLRRAIALNDRLLLTRELFAGDGQAFENTINALNGYTSFEEAKDYLLSNNVVRYSWMDKKRTDTAKNFIKLVRRRYK